MLKNQRFLNYRIFPDQQGRMNLNLSDISEEILLIPNFTVAADTVKATRQGFQRLLHQLMLNSDSSSSACY